MLTIKKKKVLVLKKWIRISIMLILIGLVFFSAYLIYTGFVPIISHEAYYSYNIKRDINYKVYLKPNDFYEEQYLESGKQYTTALIDYIDIDFLFEYDDSRQTDYEYSYNITGRLVGEYENAVGEKQEVWSKNYTYLPTQKVKEKGTEVHLNGNSVRIYYDEYNNLVNSYKNNYKLAIDSYLEITGKVRYKSTLNDETVVENLDELIIKIPLSKAAITIDTNYDDDEAQTLTHKIVNYDYKKIYLGIIIAIGSIVIFICLRNIIFVNNKTVYRKTMDKLLKDYSEIIVETTTPIMLDDYMVYEIDNFDDIVDAEEELKSPIVLYEESPGKRSYFVVMKNKVAYRFTLDINEI